MAATLLVFMAGCGSVKPTGKAADTAAVNQNQEMGLPTWCDASTFTTKENSDGGYWKGPVGEAGVYAPGLARYADIRSSTNAAELDGKAKLANYVKAEITDVADEIRKSSGGTAAVEDFDTFRLNVASVQISGIRRVDRFVLQEDATKDGETYKKGTVFVLMFVPESEIDKAIPDTEFGREVKNAYFSKIGLVQ